MAGPKVTASVIGAKALDAVADAAAAPVKRAPENPPPDAESLRKWPGVADAHEVYDWPARPGRAGHPRVEFRLTNSLGRLEEIHIGPGLTLDDVLDHRVQFLSGMETDPGSVSYDHAIYRDGRIEAIVRATPDGTHNKTVVMRLDALQSLPVDVGHAIIATANGLGLTVDEIIRRLRVPSEPLFPPEPAPDGPKVSPIVIRAARALSASVDRMAEVEAEFEKLRGTMSEDALTEWREKNLDPCEDILEAADEHFAALMRSEDVTALYDRGRLFTIDGGDVSEKLETAPNHTAIHSPGSIAGKPGD
jgi:hypothetical protein